MIYTRGLKSTMKKIYFENIQQTRLLDDKVAERVEVFMSFCHFCDRQILVSKSNLSSTENGGIYTGTVYWLTETVFLKIGIPLKMSMNYATTLISSGCNL